jgi:hypothetical protein
VSFDLREIIFNESFTPWIIGLVVVLIIGKITRSFLGDRKRTNELKNKAQFLGFCFKGSVGSQELVKLMEQTVSFSHDSRSLSTSNLMQGEVGGVSVTIADYSFYTGTGKSSKFNERTFLLIESKNMNLPSFYLKPAGWVSDRVQKLVGFQDVDFESHPQFSKKYFLCAFNDGSEVTRSSLGLIPGSISRAPSKNDSNVRELFESSGILDFLELQTGLIIEGEGNRLLFRQDLKKRIPVKKIGSFLQLGIKILSFIKAVN